MQYTYKYRFRFNAKHNTSKDEKKVHTHTFEVVCFVKQDKLDYNLVEEQIKSYLNQFKGCYLNDIMLELPTIENIANKIFNDINLIAKDFYLFRLEFSDKPIQTYIIGFEE